MLFQASNTPSRKKSSKYHHICRNSFNSLGFPFPFQLFSATHCKAGCTLKSKLSVGNAAKLRIILWSFSFAYTEGEWVGISAELLHEPDLEQSDQLLLLGLRGRVHLDTLLKRKKKKIYTSMIQVGCITWYQSPLDLHSLRPTALSV